MADDDPTLHDARRVFHFWIDDEVLDTYGPTIGPFGIAVYVYLARRSKLKKSFPSQTRIANDIGTSRDTVIRALKKLQHEQLVTIQPRVTESGDSDTNCYIIEDLSHLHAKGSSSQLQGSSSQLQGSSSQQGGVVAVSYKGSSCELQEVFPLKDSHLKDKDKELPPPRSKTRSDSPQGESGEAQSTTSAAQLLRKTRFPRDPQKQAQLKACIIDAAFLAWFAKKGLTFNIEEQWEKFAGKAIANGYRYEDWRQAFMNWLMSDFQLPHHAVSAEKRSADRKQRLEQLIAQETTHESHTD